MMDIYGKRGAIFRYEVVIGDESAAFDSCYRIGSWGNRSDAIQAAKMAGIYTSKSDADRLKVVPGSFWCELFG